MIDLSREPKKQEQQEEPLGIVLWMLMPFAVGFWWILTQGFVNGGL